jgi:hypothetical protein
MTLDITDAQKMAPTNLNFDCLKKGRHDAAVEASGASDLASTRSITHLQARA